MPVIDLKGLEGSERRRTMAQLKDAAENWGFFQIVNHGLSLELIEKLKRLTHEYHDKHLNPKFEQSDLVKKVAEAASDPEAREELLHKADWETVFFVQHLPTSNTQQIDPPLSDEFQSVITEYEVKAAGLAERLLNLFCENLGLEEGYIKEAFSGANGPFMGTKFARYPSCPRSDAVKGLRTHTDAGGIILVVQDDIPGLQFLKDGEWVDVLPVPDSIFVNTGDQLEVISNGRIKSISHRVVARADGGRLSIASFYNPASDAVIGPAPTLTYPVSYAFGDYMKIYAGTKFSEKQPRFEVLKGHAAPAPLVEPNGLVY